MFTTVLTGSDPGCTVPMTAFGAFIRVVLEAGVYILVARVSDEDWGHGTEPNVEKNSVPFNGA